jgi:NADH pyrophosphatase NudC (nudix superfamily)
MRKGVVAVIKRKNIQGSYAYLLVSTTKNYGEYTRAYYPPGGHIENNETDEHALKREIKEELGVSVKVIRLIRKIPADVPDVLVSWWECELESEEFKIKQDEIVNAGFFTKEEMKKLKLFPSTQEFFKNYN